MEVLIFELLPGNNCGIYPKKVNGPIVSSQTSSCGLRENMASWTTTSRNCCLNMAVSEHFFPIFGAPQHIQSFFFVEGIQSTLHRFLYYVYERLCLRQGILPILAISDKLFLEMSIVINSNTIRCWQLEMKLFRYFQSSFKLMPKSTFISWCVLKLF